MTKNNNTERLRIFDEDVPVDERLVQACDLLKDLIGMKSKPYDEDHVATQSEVNSAVAQSLLILSECIQDLNKKN
jgi:peroxiredoxin family protein